MEVGFPDGAVVKNLPANAEDARGFEPWVGKIPLEEEMATHSSVSLENSMDSGAWRVTVHGVAKSWTWLSMHTQMHES